MTKVSAIIPVYNGEATVAKAIDSALAQQFDGELEVVVVNDGSTDSTSQILESYGSKIEVVTQCNRGLAAARNAGVANSNSDYVAMLDADDVWLPEFLARTCAALEANPFSVLAFTDVEALSHTGESASLPPVGRAPTVEDLLSRWWGILPSAATMRRSAFEACGGFSEKFRALGGEDVWMWLRARELGEFEYLPERLVLYRVTPFAERADKYDRGHAVLFRLLRQRYGRAAEPLIDSTASYFAPGLVQKALQQMDSGNLTGGLRTLVRVLRLKPSCLLRPAYAARMLRKRNLKRMTTLLRRPPLHAQKT